MFDFFLGLYRTLKNRVLKKRGHGLLFVLPLCHDRLTLSHFRWIIFKDALDKMASNLALRRCSFFPMKMTNSEPLSSAFIGRIGGDMGFGIPG